MTKKENLPVEMKHIAVVFFYYNEQTIMEGGFSVKKSIVFIIVLFFMPALAGCDPQTGRAMTPPAQEETKENQAAPIAGTLTQGEIAPPAQEETKESQATPIAGTLTQGEAEPDATVLKTPPVLTVIYDNQSAEALKGTYFWTYSNEDDTYTSISADSMHPLQAKEHMPLLELTSVDDSSDPPKGYLQWDTVPDTVSVRCWKEECWGQTGSESENIPVKTLGTDFIMEWKDGNYIYEVSAEWNSSEFWGGTALYSFYAEKTNK